MENEQQQNVKPLKMMRYENKINASFFGAHTHLARCSTGSGKTDPD
jgi:hypothetical protein